MLPAESQPALVGKTTAPSTAPRLLNHPADFLLEIGTEELPAGDLQDALTQLQQNVPQMLEELRLTHATIRVLGTPRRLTVIVEDLVDRQTDRETVVKGRPPNAPLMKTVTPPPPPSALPAAAAWM